MKGAGKQLNKGRVFLLLGGTLLLGLFAVFCVLYIGMQIPVFDQSGWDVAPSGEHRYLDYYGRTLKKWQELDGERYYFHPESGEMMTGWLDTEDGTFYLEQTGQMLTGFLEKEGARYYLTESGALGTGWLETEEGLCYGNEDGKLATGWLELENKRYYLDDDGIAVSGWQELDDLRYYFMEDGSAASGWLTLGENTYFLKPEGGIHTGWLEENGTKYFLNEEGIRHTGWLTLPEGRYYLKDDGSCATGFVAVAEVDRYFLETGEYVPLVNPWNQVPDDYVLNLVEIDGFQLDVLCEAPLLQMLLDCESAGYDCGINSAYRSMEKQQQLWDERYEEYKAAGYGSEEAKTLTGREVAIPGTSEHHLGLAVDISGYADTYAWLEEHSWEYGFIRRYPDEKLDVTGIVYEPWHYRYVGKELAQQLYTSGLCLEEYLEQRNGF